MNLGRRLDEKPGGLVMVGDEDAYVSDARLDAGDGRFVERIFGQDRESDSDLVEAAGVRRRVAEMHVLMTLQSHVALGLVRRDIVRDDMDFALRMGGDELVYEVEEFDAPPSVVSAFRPPGHSPD